MELPIYGNIGSEGLTASAIRQQLAGKTGDLLVRIHSDGGDALEGLAINSVLRGYTGGKVTVQVDGVAASAASVIAMAGGEIVMADGAMMMLHNPSIECAGDGDALRGYATMLDAMASSYAAEYARRMGCGADQARALMERSDWSVGTWLTAQEALAQGLATRIGPPVTIRAQARPTLLPDQLRRAYARSTAAMNKADVMKALALEGDPDEMTARAALASYMESTGDGPDKRKEMAKAFADAFPAKAPDEKKDGEPDGDEAKAAALALAETKAALAAARAELADKPDVEKVKEEAAKAEAKFRADVEEWVKAGQIKDSPESRAKWLAEHRAGTAARAVALIDKGTWTTSQRLRSGNVGTPVEAPGSATKPAPVSPLKAEARALVQKARNLGAPARGSVTEEAEPGTAKAEARALVQGARTIDKDRGAV